MIDVGIEKALCNFCFDHPGEFNNWSGNRVYTNKEERFKASNEFWEYAQMKLSRPCVEIYFDYEKTYICLECLTEMVNLLRKYNDTR